MVGAIVALFFGAALAIETIPEPIELPEEPAPGGDPGTPPPPPPSTEVPPEPEPMPEPIPLPEPTPEPEPVPVPIPVDEAIVPDPTDLKQYCDDGVTALSTGDYSYGASAYLECAVGPTLFTIEFEVQPVSSGFTGVGHYTMSGTGTVKLQATGLTHGFQYHWQVRVKDGAGVASLWVAYGGNAETSADYICGNPPNQSPLATNPAQYHNGATADIPTGGDTSNETVHLSAVLSDPENDACRLEIEVRPIGVGLTGDATATSAYVPSGLRQTIIVTLVPGGHHWAYRACDANGNVSNWISFGANSEAQVDFSIVLPVASTGRTPVKNSCGNAATGSISTAALALVATIALALAVRRA